MPRRDLPAEIASTVDAGEGVRLSAPSAARNIGPLTDLLRHHGPAAGPVLEIASGTGEHALAFSAAFPALAWQPTEIDPARRASIDAWAATRALPNLTPAIALDATEPGWGKAHPGHALVLLVNLLHLISEPEARTLIAEIPQALAPGGRVILSGLLTHQEPMVRGAFAGHGLALEQRIRRDGWSTLVYRRPS